MKSDSILQLPKFGGLGKEGLEGGSQKVQTSSYKISTMDIKYNMMFYRQ